MASVFPYTNGLPTNDTFSDPLSTSPLNSPSHSALHTDVNTAVETIETILQSGGGSRNLLYNGAMQVHQRVAAATNVTGITTTDYRTADRWRSSVTSLGTWTQSVENDAPTGSGFRKSLKMVCTTQNTSPGSTAYLAVQQLLEGQDVQAIRKGTSSAQQLTVSFWVKAGLTGTFICALYDIDNNRSVSKSYTISTANTWEFKTINFPADTTGAFDNDNAVSLYLEFILGAGSSFTGGTLATTWGTYTANNYAVGQTNLASGQNASVNYWQVTGVQLNVGAVAAPFEFKSFGQELRECMRYYEKSYAIGTAPATNTASGVLDQAVLCDASGYPIFTLVLQVPKRGTGWTMTFYRLDGTAGSWELTRYTSATNTYNTMTYDNKTERSARVYTSAATAAAREPCRFAGHWVVSDEL